jgi:hypothetical protein
LPGTNTLSYYDSSDIDDNGNSSNVSHDCEENDDKDIDDNRGDYSDIDDNSGEHSDIDDNRGDNYDISDNGNSSNYSHDCEEIDDKDIDERRP